MEGKHKTKEEIEELIRKCDRFKSEDPSPDAQKLYTMIREFLDKLLVETIENESKDRSI